jgi:hypothetical protein
LRRALLGKRRGKTNINTGKGKERKVQFKKQNFKIGG